MPEWSENFKKEVEIIGKHQPELTDLVENTITELQNTIEGFDNRLDEAEERFRKLKNRESNSNREAKKQNRKQ